MKKRFYLLKIADACEFAFVLTTIIFLASCFTRSDVQGSNSLLHSITCAFVITGLAFVITQWLLCMYLLRSGEPYIKHRRFKAIENAKDPYQQYCNSLQLRRYSIWWKFVFGINVNVALGECICLTLCFDSVLVAFFSIKDNWQFRQVIVPLCMIICLTSIIVIYKTFSKVFRSATGLVRHLINDKTSMHAVNEDYRSAKKITNNLFVSSSRIFFRDSHSVIVLYRRNVTDYRLLDRRIALELQDGIMPVIIKPNSKMEYDAISKALLRTTY